MITRRAAITTGAAFASTALAGGLDAHAAATGHAARCDAAPFDVLLIDETIAVPQRIAGLMQRDGRKVPELAVGLDATDQRALATAFARAGAIVGISSGASLFCLERMAWDNGFRLTTRHVWRSDDVTALHCLTAITGGAPVPAPAAASSLRAYRPSRADGLIHIWTMHKPVRPATRPTAPETMA